MTTTTPTAKLPPATDPAQEAVEAAKTKLANTTEALTQAGLCIVAAQTAIERIERDITSGNADVTPEELADANSKLQYFTLRQRAQATAVETAQDALRQAITAQIMTRIEDGSYQIHMDGLQSEGQALAEQIAALLTAYKEKCEAHNAARRQLLADVLESDAVNNDGVGNPHSPLVWGHENGGTHNPKWITVHGEQVPALSPFQVDRVAKHAAMIVSSGVPYAKEHHPI